ncbi:hypothetical protein HUG10_21210 (plasmid) [Halorarum halophilum]|uniref:Uncharacterized protein n=1 Tax=Halorarum halophilum TaxID=2743090 RepID=A0A7D5GHX2_9EURY|nr:hypothetical protein [Halobaculum halophilum]QLG30108.1 hypothetical protein HUG10_21210 [Halobaculum halophilum]
MGPKSHPDGEEVEVRDDVVVALQCDEASWKINSERDDDVVMSEVESAEPLKQMWRSDDVVAAVVSLMLRDDEEAVRAWATQSFVEGPVEALGREVSWASVCVDLVDDAGEEDAACVAVVLKREWEEMWEARGKSEMPVPKEQVAVEDVEWKGEVWMVERCEVM